jgi:hypothetical protein
MALQGYAGQGSSAKIHTPSLVIMLGSTPGKAGLEICRQMLTFSPADCRRLALVHIDTAVNAGEVASFYKDYEGLFRVFPLRIAIPVSINYAPMPAASLHTYIPSKLPQPFANGAGGIRNNGHVAAAFDHPRIKQTLEAALQHLELLGTSQGEQSVREVHVNIIAFLGGGTGSGILGDIAVMVRQLLLERLYEQRINLFCILPDWIQGTNNNDINWRKSNATACLLELIALSLAGDVRRQLTYRKWMLNYAYDVSADAIANEIYLIGRTSMGSAEDTARIVGLDLFQRIVDGSGVGLLEHDTWSNRRSLGATDDRGLPTMFATSCPMEVRFPAHETARAFAQIASSFLLPKIVGNEPAVPDVDEEMREGWRQEWGVVAELTDQTQGRNLAVRPAPPFAVSAFFAAPVETLDGLWGEVQRLRKVTVQRLEVVIRQKREEELKRINRVPVALNSHLGPLTRQINHLHLLREEYTMVLLEVKRGADETIVPEQPLARHSIFYMLPVIGKALKMRDAEYLCYEYNEALHLHAVKVRYNLLQHLLEDLLHRVDQLLQEKLGWYRFRDEHLSRSCKELANAGFSSAAWHGKLDLPHPHQRHIFDLNSLQQTNRCQAVERLFMYVTFPPSEDEWRSANVADLKFDETLVKQQIDCYIDACTSYLNRRSLADESNLAEEMELEGREQFVERIVSFFVNHYMQSFLGNETEGRSPMNLFHLLKIGAGLDRTATVSHYLLEHLSHIRGLMRSLVAFQETLWHEGPDRLAITVFLGMCWEEGAHQQQDLRQAVNMLGSLTSNNQTPQIEKTEDPHRLQVSYGQHGISLATVPEFFRDTNSAMAEYLRHQGEWYGDQLPAILPQPFPSSYGRNKMPVHNSGEMERLVCDPDALNYHAGQPHASKYGTNLIGRVIREAESLHDKPDWGSAQGVGKQAPPSPPRPPLMGPPIPSGPMTPPAPAGPSLPPQQPARVVKSPGPPRPVRVAPRSKASGTSNGSSAGANSASSSAQPAKQNQAASQPVTSNGQTNLAPPRLQTAPQEAATLISPLLAQSNFPTPSNAQPPIGMNNSEVLDQMLNRGQQTRPGSTAPGTPGKGDDTNEPDTQLNW